MNTPSAAAAASILLALTGCAEPKRDPVPDSRPYAAEVRQAEQDWATWIVGTRWSLARIEGAPPIDGAAAALSFKPEETWMSGSAGCNTFTGTYIRRGAAGIEIGPLAVTRKFCHAPEGVMQQESRILYLLDTADSYAATRDTFTLFIDAEPVLIYTATP